MRKKTFFLLLFFSFLLLAMPKGVLAQQQVQIDDQAGILSSVDTLESSARTIADHTKASIFVVTTRTNHQSPQAFSENYLENKIGVGENGIVLLIDMGQRHVYIFADGNMQWYITESRIDSILDEVQPDLANGNYQEGVQTFLRAVQYYVGAGIPGGRSYTVDEQTGEITFHRSFRPMFVLIALGVALVGAVVFVVVTVSRYQLKMGTWKYPYNQKGSISLTKRQDILTNSFVRTRKIPRNTNSGGGFGGGGGRSF